MDAIQNCGGQKTADGRRFRTGGGILWSILKVRDPNAYKEIMKKGQEFEVGYNSLAFFLLIVIPCACGNFVAQPGKIMSSIIRCSKHEYFRLC